MKARSKHLFVPGLALISWLQINENNTESIDFLMQIAIQALYSSIRQNISYEGKFIFSSL